MDVSWKGNGPVVIGGLGGSGTRVVAEIMAIFGYYIGSDLNSASDNLWYTFLFKRPIWYRLRSFDSKVIASGLRLFEKMMLRSSFPNLSEVCYLAGAFMSMCTHGFSVRHQGAGRPKWALRRLLRMGASFRVKDADYVGWGWKEPNSHMLLKDMANQFESFRYIHTIRHGLDMAFSDKQDQMQNWGPLFGLECPKRAEDLPVASYRFWVHANRRVVDFGRKMGEDRFLLVHFERLCSDPAGEISRIADFLQAKPTSEQFARAVNLVEPQKTTGRYLKHGVEMFRGEELDALREMGYPAVEIDQ